MQCSYSQTRETPKRVTTQEKQTMAKGIMNYRKLKQKMLESLDSEEKRIKQEIETLQGELKEIAKLRETYKKEETPQESDSVQ